MKMGWGGGIVTEVGPKLTKTKYGPGLALKKQLMSLPHRE